MKPNLACLFFPCLHADIDTCLPCAGTEKTSLRSLCVCLIFPGFACLFSAFCGGVLLFQTQCIFCVLFFFHPKCLLFFDLSRILTTKTFSHRCGNQGLWPANADSAPVDRSVLTPQHMHDYAVLCQNDVEKISRTLKFYLEALDAATILHAQPSAQGAAARQRAQQEKQYLTERYQALIERVQTSTVRRYSQVLTMSPQREDTAKKAPRAMLLELWFMEHVDTPYPSSEEKEALARLCSMSARQLATWFTNKRARFKRSAVHREAALHRPLPESVPTTPRRRQRPSVRSGAGAGKDKVDCCESGSREEQVQCRRPRKKRPRPAVSHPCTHFRASEAGARVAQCPQAPPALLSPLFPLLRLCAQERTNPCTESVEDWLLEIAREDSALIGTRAVLQRGNQYTCTPEDLDGNQSARTKLFSDTQPPSGSSESLSQQSGWLRGDQAAAATGNTSGYYPEP